MSTLIRRDSPFGDVVEWLEAPWTALRPMTSPMRVEDYLTAGDYVVRAEIPGVDPEKDIEVTVTRGVLTIKAERHEDGAGRRHSEFRYGTFSRSLTLPPAADEHRIDAVYSHGILEVTVPLAGGDQPQARSIPVRQDQHIRPS